MKALMLGILVLVVGCVGENYAGSTCAVEWRETQINITESFQKEALCGGLDARECGCNTDAPFGGVRSVKEWTCKDKRILEEYLPGAGLFIVREVIYPLTLENNKGLPSRVVGDPVLEACYASKIDYTGCSLTDVRLYCVK